MKTAVDAQRAGTVFVLPPEDPRLVLVNDPKSPLYDERLALPVSEELALSIAREGQIQAGRVRKNGVNKLEILDGRQRFRAALLANEWIKSGDARVAFRGGQLVQFKFEVVRPEDEQSAVRQVLAANLRVDETPIVRAKRIARALKWGLTLDDVRVAYGFKSKATVEGILMLLDCAPLVQQALERREIPESVARRFVGLDHVKQVELLNSMRDKGVMRGASARRAVAEKKAGGEVTGTEAKRMLSRDFIEAFAVQLDAVRAPAAVVAKAILRFLLGEKDALGGSEMTPYSDAAKRARR